MKKLILLILFITAPLLYAGPDYLTYRHAAGMKASNLSGYGAFYGYKVSPEWRVQATGIYYLYDNQLGNAYHTISNYTIGTEVQRDLIQEARYRCYLMAGAYYYHDDDEQKSGSYSHIIKNSYNAGFGAGYEYYFKRVSLGAELGYKFYRDFSRDNEGSGDWVPIVEKVSKIGAGLNLGFIF